MESIWAYALVNFSKIYYLGKNDDIWYFWLILKIKMTKFDLICLFIGDYSILN